MIKEFEGIKPTIDNKTYIADGTHIIGKVTITSYNSRCPECGKLRAMITIDSNVISRSNYTTTK